MNEPTPSKETKKKQRRDFLRRHLFDGILIVALALGTSSFFIVRAVKAAQKQSDFLQARITLEGALMEIPGKTNPIDLNAVSSYEEFSIEGRHTSLVIGIKHNAICVVSSACPGQECVHEGWVSSANHPIICAYNGVYIDVQSSSWSSVIVR